MKTGDNPAWACPDFVHKDWEPIEVGKPWEQAGYPGYDGDAWYRLKLVIPEAWRMDPRVRESGKDAALVLVLGYVDDVDVTYFNGHQIGATGMMPPDYREAYDRLRKYLIPLDQVRWGQANVIAVRVYDGQRDGGIYSGPIRLRTPGLSDIIDLDFQVVNSDGIYFSPGPLPVRFRITNRSEMSYSLDFQCTLKSDRVYDDAVLDQRSTRLQIGGKSAHTHAIRFTPRAAGFYQVTCSLRRGPYRAIP